ncbi:hypothetical protein LIER_21158 [Lithospermum erythrorhizon]|uniref:Uncharacterized protein n=1 Tax=Lithospermum erythrorhizon TaxID=34254 RepID=A0AAV3QS20_LITER
MPLRSIPPVVIDTNSEAEAPAIHNNYLPWVDYTNVRELDNSRSSDIHNADDDVGDEKVYTEINNEEMVEEVAEEPIVEDRVLDSSYVAMSDTAGLIRSSVKPSVNDRCEPSTVNESVEDDVEDCGPTSENVMANADKGPDHAAEDVVPDVAEEPSTEGLEIMKEPSVKNTFNDTTVPDDLLKTSDAGESMSSDIPSVSATKPATEEAHGDDAQGDTNTLNEDTVFSSPETKKSKKRKLKKISEAGPSEPKLSKEEKVAKKARRAEKRARKAARRSQRVSEADATTEKEVEETVAEETEVIPPVMHTSVDEEWLPDQEQQANDPHEDSDEEDVAAVMERRRKAKGKLRINENRTRIGNRRIPKNVADVPTTNVSLSFEE